MRKKNPSPKPKPQASSPRKASKGFSLPKGKAFPFLLGGVFLALGLGLFLRPSPSGKEVLPPSPPPLGPNIPVDPEPSLPPSSPPSSPKEKSEEKPSPSDPDKDLNLSIRDPFIYPEAPRESSPPSQGKRPSLPPLPETPLPPLPLPGEKPPFTPPDEGKSYPKSPKSLKSPPPQVLALLSSEEGGVVLILGREGETVEVRVGVDAYGGYRYRFRRGKVVALSLEGEASFFLQQDREGKYAWKPLESEGKSAREDL